MITAVIRKPLLPETPHKAIRACFKSRFIHSANTPFRSRPRPVQTAHLPLIHHVSKPGANLKSSFP
ncbi:hypothetical protein AGR7C_Cc260027 [Agrobacterium deltaense Zutra 3/1]|uniref:Uncharacterized protein n=1 Tax=Agrobacterium deltaense Zutra 3/1 TaxID=1183427 RepID=A0A1S7Q4S9_9HYPH|nr:hypothetical protein AGR7C_Cc260027 [Agrobacterium deltaense Zutra 3/1]